MVCIELYYIYWPHVFWVRWPQSSSTWRGGPGRRACPAGGAPAAPAPPAESHCWAAPLGSSRSAQPTVAPRCGGWRKQAALVAGRPAIPCPTGRGKSIYGGGWREQARPGRRQRGKERSDGGPSHATCSITKIRRSGWKTIVNTTEKNERLFQFGLKGGGELT